MKLLYRILLTCDAIGLFFVVYLVKSNITILQLNIVVSFVIYVGAVLLLTYMCLVVTKKLPDETITGGICEVELANNSYLPIYLGYFFVALSVNSFITLFCVGALIIVFTYLSQSLYFNPLFLLFGYKFYYITTENGMKLFVLTKKSIKSINGLKFEKLKRVNDYTFIERG